MTVASSELSRESVVAFLQSSISGKLHHEKKSAFDAIKTENKEMVAK